MTYIYPYQFPTHNPTLTLRREVIKEYDSDGNLIKETIREYGNTDYYTTYNSGSPKSPNEYEG